MFNPALKPAHQFEALKEADKVVTLHLRGNHTFKGTLSSWSDEFVVLSGVGDETHDVLVRVSDIAAVSAVVR